MTESARCRCSLDFPPSGAKRCAKRLRFPRFGAAEGPPNHARSPTLIEIAERDGSIIVFVRVVPRGSRDAIEGEYDGALKIRLTAPALENRANEALRRLLAERLNVPIAAVRIVAGEKSRSKRLAIAGVTRDQIAALAARRPK